MIGYTLMKLALGLVGLVTGWFVTPEAQSFAAGINMTSMMTSLVDLGLAFNPVFPVREALGSLGVYAAGWSIVMIGKLFLFIYHNIPVVGGHS